MLPLGDSVSVGDRSYTIRVAIQPPQLISVGTAMYPPIVVLVNAFNSTGEEVNVEDEVNSLFVQATLYNESGNRPPLAPPDGYLLSGRLSMSLEPLSDPALEESNTDRSSNQSVIGNGLGSFAAFPDLTINRLGSYRVGISLFKVDDGRQMQRGSGSAVQKSPRGGGMLLAEAKTNTIVIQSEKSPVIEIGISHLAFLHP